MRLATSFIALFTLLLFTHPIKAQTLENHFYGNTMGADILPEHLIALNDGSAVLTGKTNTLDTGGYHVLLIRTDSLGNVLWQRTYHQGTGKWVCKALDGGFIVGGSSNRHLFGPEQGFILKVNESGVEEWHQYLPNGDHSYLSNVAQLSSGDIAVCGVVVNEGSNASQKVFWALFDAGGGLKKQEQIGDLESSSAPKIVEAKNGNLILGWSTNASGGLRCFTPSGQIIWEHELGTEFGLAFGQNKSLLVDSIGDLWVAGGFANYFADFSRQLLHFSGTGDLKHRITHDSWTDLGASALFQSQNGTISLWFAKHFGDYLEGYVKLKLSSQGAVVERDSFIFPSFQRIKSIAKVNENRLLLLNVTPFEKSDIRLQPIQKSPSGYQFTAPWLLSTGRPYSHELYEAHCKSLSGGEFILTRGEGKLTELLQLGYYILRINEDNLALTRTYIGDGFSSRGGQIQPTADGGAIALTYNGFACKVNANADLIWSKQAKNGKLFTGPNNDFFIAEFKSQPGIYDPINIYYFNSVGDSISVEKVYSKSQPYYLVGGISQIDNGPMLFANKYVESDKHWHNWLIYLDKEGKLVSEILLDSTYQSSSFTNQTIQTADGGALIASHLYSNQSIYLMHVKDGEVLWKYNLFSSDPDSINIDLVAIEELPCYGYVVAFTANNRYTNTLSTTILTLHHIDENGKGQGFYTYKPLPGLVNPDTNFLPGYTFRHWGYQLNGQTYDVHLQTVHFDDTSKVNLPVGHLTIMPNPSGDEICLHYESASYGLLDIAIFNTNGQRMDRFKSEKTTSEWLFHYHSNYPAGTYFIQIKKGEKERVIQQWVKIR